MSNPKFHDKVSDWLGDCECDLLDKRRSRIHYVETMLNRTRQIFEYDGLPETIPAYMLETMLQLRGHVSITKVKGELYAFTGNFGGAPDPYYRPTLYVIANPGLGISEMLAIKNYLPPFDKLQAHTGECVVMHNDTRHQGLLYMFSRYAAQMTENDISLRSAQINARQQTLISTSTDSEAASAKEYIEGLEAGKISAVAAAPFLEGLSVTNVSTQSSNSIIQLIELQQYLKASWFNEIGLEANFNMKREYMSEEEIAVNTDNLLPLVDDMLACREEALDLVNQIYGTNITVHKNSAWQNKVEEVELSMDAERAKIEEGGESDASERDVEDVDNG